MRAAEADLEEIRFTTLLEKQASESPSPGSSRYATPSRPSSTSLPDGCSQQMNYSLGFENRMVLAAVQALIGSISPSMAAISISVDADKGTAELYVALHTADATITPTRGRRHGHECAHRGCRPRHLAQVGWRRLDHDLAGPGSPDGVRGAFRDANPPVRVGP